MTTLLDRVVAEAKCADGPLLMRDLAARLGVEESALRGMVQVLVRKGRISASEIEFPRETSSCPDAACWRKCTGLANCPLVAEVPTSYALISSPAAPTSWETGRPAPA
jgi:hypothetical protein